MQVVTDKLNIRNKLFCGNTLDVLKQFESESVDMCITSPPYWGLRNYKSEPQIWDSVNGCAHDFQAVNTKHVGNRNGLQDQGSTLKTASRYIDPIGMYSSGMCRLCNAWKGELGMEPTFQMYIQHLVQIFDEVKRVLKKTGSCWVNLGDTYNHDKSLCMIPERFGIEMIDHGWILRNKIIWHKPNSMPSSAKDRFGTDWEYLFFFVKQQKYFFETQYQPSTSDYSNRAIKRGFNPEKQSYMDWYYNDRPKKGFHNHSNDKFEGMMQTKQIGCLNSPLGSLKRSVWKIPTKAFSLAHFAVFAPALIETPIKATCPKGICQKCGHFRKLLYEKITVNTRPGLDKEEGAKSHTDADPNYKLHNGEYMQRPITMRFPKFGGNRAEEYGNPVYSGKEWNPIMRSLKSMGADSNGDYTGMATKDYRSAKAQNPSDTKRRILASYKKRANSIPIMSECECKEYQPGICLDPFIGSGTTALVCMNEGVDFCGIELKESYISMAKDRIVEERCKIFDRGC